MSLFISHGSPMLCLEQTPAHDFLAALAAQLPSVQAVIVVSAHWQTPDIQVSAAARPALIHDFSGFPERLYQMTWPAPGDPSLAAEVVSALNGAGLKASVNTSRGIDHGVWVPLSLIWPQANVRVVQVSLPLHAEAVQLWKMGQRLAALESDEVLLIGSGSLTHNLGALRMPVQQPEDVRVARFREALDAVLQSDQRDDLSRWQQLAFAAFHHPTDEHFQPLLVAAAAPGSARRLHSSTEYGVLAMDAWQFGQAASPGA